VLVAAEGTDNGWTGLLPMEKWTPIENLAAAIEAAALRRLPPSA
jgi:hypothetical protein